MNVTGPLTISAVSAGGDWSNPTNAEVEDGSVASNANVGPGGGGHTPSQLVGTACGFNIPSDGIIDGILLEAKVDSSSSKSYSVVIRTSSKTSSDRSNHPNGVAWPAALSWVSWGGSTDLWGQSWTASDINSSSFGGSISAYPSTGTDTIQVDSMRLTVYWHVPPTAVPKQYYYQVFDNQSGQYLGLLPNVKSDFSFSQEINNAGSQITIECAISADTSSLSPNLLIDESQDQLTDESGNALTTEGQQPIVSVGATSSLIKNGNRIKVYEFGYWNPNGKCVFLGQMQRWEAEYGGTGGDDLVRILCYSDGSDLDNYIMRGEPYILTTDQSQETQNTSTVISYTASPLGWDFLGQSFTVGVGVTNVAAISLAMNGSATVTVSLYTNSGAATLLGSSTQTVSVVEGDVSVFQFADPIQVVAGTQYFFGVSVASGDSITIYYDTSTLYTKGQIYTSTYSGGGGGDWSAGAGSMWFATSSGIGSTKGSLTSQDPTTGMLASVLNDYTARGGLITYTTSSLTATGTSLSVGFQTNTTLEGIKLILSICPSNYYWTVDLGTDIISMQPSPTSANFILTKGLHLDKVTIIATIESIVNEAYFTGGSTGSDNLYVLYVDATSADLYGPRMDRPSDSNVTDLNTGRAIAKSDVITQKNEQYQTTVTILDKTMDTTLIKPGSVIGFNGFGTFVDSLLMQVVRIDYAPEEVVLTLGILPKRLHPEFDRIVRGVVALDTIDNPTSPS